MSKLKETFGVGSFKYSTFGQDVSHYIHQENL